MASGLALTLRPAAAVVRASAAPGGERRRSPARSWWSPLFGWAAEPDYIDGGATSAPTGREEEEGVTRPAAKKFAALTEEKARELRMRMKETEIFHDAMYHSAIASRLASDRTRRRSALPLKMRD